MAAVDGLNELQKAIYAFMWTAANDFKTACSGGFYYDQFPEDKGEVHPFAFYFFTSIIDDRDSCSKSFEAHLQVTFKDRSSNSDGSKRSSEILSAVIAEFHERFLDCEDSLTMTNFTAISVDSIDKNFQPPRLTVAKRWESHRNYRIQVDRK